MMEPLFSPAGPHPRISFQYRQEIRVERQTDQACAHLPIGLPAHGCGFASQAHATWRFKGRHGATPGEYRHAALVGAP